MATETAVDWNTAIQVEQYKAAQVTSAMQAIAAVPVFDGRDVDLEFFIRRMDIIVQQVSKNPFDEVTNNYILGYFYSRISMEVLMEVGASCETPWEQVKVLLREKFGGAGKTIPRLILREVLIERDSNQGMGDFARAVIGGVRKVKARIRDSGAGAEEIRVRCTMLEELASECIQSNLTRRAKQWVRLNKPAGLENLVKTVVEEEQEDREERRKVPRRVTEREEGKEPITRTDFFSGWQRAPRVKNRWVQDRQTTGMRGNSRRPTERPARIRREPFNRSRQCWECREEGHFARECPYIYRRDKKRQYTGEPMEVNTTRRWRNRRTEDSGSETDSSAMSSQSEKGRKETTWAERIRHRKREEPKTNEASRE